MLVGLGNFGASQVTHFSRLLNMRESTLFMALPSRVNKYPGSRYL